MENNHILKTLRSSRFTPFIPRLPVCVNASGFAVWGVGWCIIWPMTEQDFSHDSPNLNPADDAAQTAELTLMAASEALELVSIPQTPEPRPLDAPEATESDPAPAADAEPVAREG